MTHTKTANFAAGLLEEYEALWTFCDVPDLAIDPTNNAAERAVRHAVLMRSSKAAPSPSRAAAGSSASNRSARPAACNTAPASAYSTHAATAAHHRHKSPHCCPPPHKAPDQVPSGAHTPARELTQRNPRPYRDTP